MLSPSSSSHQNWAANHVVGECVCFNTYSRCTDCHISLCRLSYKIDWPDLVSSSVSKSPQVSPESMMKEPLRAAFDMAAGQNGWVGCIRQAAEWLVLYTQCSAVDVTEQAHCCCYTYTCSAACMLDWHL